MIKLGVNSVLFQDLDFAGAVKHIAECGYDGVEISAIEGMCEHLVLSNWKAQASDLKQIVADAGIEFLAMEETKLDDERLKLAFEAAAEIGIPVVNVGSGGKTGVDDDLTASIEMLAKMSEAAASFGVTLCVKAHVGAAIHNTETTLRAIEAIGSPGFGIDMDPSHIYRAGEDPKSALPAVIDRVRHIHIRDCKGRERGPGPARDQACGRGDIDLLGYCKAMVDGGYDGPVCLEVIGGSGLDLSTLCTIAAESYGYLHATLKALGAR